MFRLRDGRVFGRRRRLPAPRRAHRGRADRRHGRVVPAAPERVRASRTGCSSTSDYALARVSRRGGRRRRHRCLSAGDAGDAAPTRPSHQLQTRQRSTHKPRTPPAPSTPRSIKRPTRRTFHDDRSHLRGAAARRAHHLAPPPAPSVPRPTTASTGSRTGARRTRSSGQTQGAPIAKRNLIFSVFSEHIGFSVWSLWSVIVLFLGPEYGIDPAGKFLLTALPTLAGAALRLPYTFAVAKFGGRNWTIISALLLLIPTVLIAIFLVPGVSFTTLLIVADVRGRRRRQLRLLDGEHQRLLPAAAQGLGARHQRRRRQPRRAGGAAGRPADPGDGRGVGSRGCWW